MTTASSRRGFLTALAAFTGAGPAGAASTVNVGISHVDPDHALHQADARWRQAVAYRKEADARAGAAYGPRERRSAPARPNSRLSGAMLPSLLCCATSTTI